MLLTSPLISEVEPPRYLICSTKRLNTVLLFSLATLVALSLGSNLALSLGAGNLLEERIIQLNFNGGLVVGGLIGLAQWAALCISNAAPARNGFSKQAWVVVTALGWAVAMELSYKGLCPIEFNVLSGPIYCPLTFVVLGVAQWFALHRSVKQSWRWLVLPLIQVLFVVILQGILQIAAFGIFILTLANVANPSTPEIAWFHAAATVLYHIEALAHSMIPAIGLCMLCRK